jgi:hypothetical protein
MVSQKETTGWSGEDLFLITCVVARHEGFVTVQNRQLFLPINPWDNSQGRTQQHQKSKL